MSALLLPNHCYSLRGVAPWVRYVTVHTHHIHSPTTIIAALDCRVHSHIAILKACHHWPPKSSSKLAEDVQSTSCIFVTIKVFCRCQSTNLSFLSSSVLQINASGCVTITTPQPGVKSLIVWWACLVSNAAEINTHPPVCCYSPPCPLSPLIITESKQSSVSCLGSPHLMQQYIWHKILEWCESK